MIEYALIVAGGSGTRMQSAMPKQFIEIGGLPVLMHTIHAFHHYSSQMPIILVLPKTGMNTWHNLVTTHDFTIPHKLISGGNTRFESVKNGLDSIDSDGLVAIHDGVRPFISVKIIRNCFAVAGKKGAAITAVTPKDSIREIKGKVENQAVKREHYRLVQTPQTFKIDIIKQAYSTQKDTGFTDDASVAESAGYPISLVEGDYKNIKITTPEDLKIAQALLADINDLSN